MFPLIALAAISVASSIAGGISANKKQRKADQILSDRERNLKEWYNSEMNMPYLDRADSRAMLKRIRDYNEDELKAMNTNAVKSGATDEAKVAQQKLFADPRPDRGAWRTAQRSSAPRLSSPHGQPYRDALSSATWQGRRHAEYD